MSSIEHRSLADQYLARRIAARDHLDVESLAGLPAHTLDLLLPGVRALFEHRVEVAQALLVRRGIDPTAPEYTEAVIRARGILAGVDSISSDHAT